MPVEDEDTKLALDAMVARVALAARRTAQRGAMLVQRRAQSKLHVGYGVVSGTMRRSIHVQGPEPLGEGAFRARVGASVIYARRFELGFFAKDAIGRVYMKRGTQPEGLLGSIARPLIKPAHREAIPAVREIAIAELTTAIRG